MYKLETKRWFDLNTFEAKFILFNFLRFKVTLIWRTHLITIIIIHCYIHLTIECIYISVTFQLVREKIHYTFTLFSFFVTLHSSKVSLFINSLKIIWPHNLAFIIGTLLSRSPKNVHKVCTLNFTNNAGTCHLKMMHKVQGWSYKL